MTSRKGTHYFWQRKVYPLTNERFLLRSPIGDRKRKYFIRHDLLRITYKIVITRKLIKKHYQNLFSWYKSELTLSTYYTVSYSGIFLSGGTGGHCPLLNFDNPKRSKIWYVVCGTIIRRVAAAAKCESSAIDFWIFFKPFLDVLWDIWTSEPRGVKVHNCGPFN